MWVRGSSPPCPVPVSSCYLSVTPNDLSQVLTALPTCSPTLQSKAISTPLEPARWEQRGGQGQMESRSVKS